MRDAEGLAAIWKATGRFKPEDAQDTRQARTEVKPGSLKKSKDRASSPQSARMLDLQTRLATAVSLPVKVTGKPEKGRISLSYNNSEELYSLLAFFGLGAEENR